MDELEKAANVWSDEEGLLDDPFAAFCEWADAADDEAYRDL